MKRTVVMLMGSAMLCGVMSLPVRVRAAVTDGDKQFLEMAAQGDMNEIKLSELAETKATDPEVRAFARKMVADHSQLEAEMKPFATEWGLTPPTGLDREHHALYDKLAMVSGTEFDMSYMNMMDVDHHKALDAFTNEVNTTTDARFKAAVMKGKSVVAEHTAMADDLKAKL